VERGELDMAALGGLHVIAAGVAMEMRHAEPGPGPEHAHGAALGKRTLRSGDMDELVFGRSRHGMRDRAEVVDQRECLESELVVDRADVEDPRIVRHADRVAHDRRRDRYRGVARERGSDPAFELLPRRLQAGVVVGLERDRLADVDRAAGRDRGARETRVRAADVERDEFRHRPDIASIAEPPRSASSAPARNIAHSSRAVPSSISRISAGARPEKSALVESWPVSAQSRITSPSCRKARGPPPSASGLTWIALGTLPLAPDIRPSVTSATLCPRSCSTPSTGVSLCSSGIPFARGP